LIKIKNFCASKDAIRKRKRQSTEWQEIFANHIFDKGPVSRIYKELLQLTTRQLNLKRAKDWNRHFSQVDAQMADKHMERRSASLVIREIETKTTNEIPLHTPREELKGDTKC